MAASRSRFLAYLKLGATILDAGCGSGRDSHAFAQLGYDVTAFDGSAEMVRLARGHARIPVFHKVFAEVDWVGRFDGIWSCASLLHVPKSELPDAMSRLAQALRAGGTWFMSFKYGDGERETRERHFTDMREADLEQAIDRTGLGLAEMWLSKDVRPERAHETWISAIARREG
jgi:SAM-dependent methyltransferase